MARYSPWRHLRDLVHLNLRWTDDQDELDGMAAWYYHWRSEIVMDKSLTQVERRCVLAHEVAHALRGDRPCREGALDARQEAAADQWAARNLIELSALGDVVVWTDDLDEAAEELWVIPELLDVRLKTLQFREKAYLTRRVKAKEEPC